MKYKLFWAQPNRCSKSNMLDYCFWCFSDKLRTVFSITNFIWMSMTFFLGMVTMKKKVCLENWWVCNTLLMSYKWRWHQRLVRWPVWWTMVIGTHTWPGWPLNPQYQQETSRVLGVCQCMALPWELQQCAPSTGYKHNVSLTGSVEYNCLK